MPRIAVVGCGAIAEMFHLPALARDQEVMRETILVDVDHERAGYLATQFGAGASAADYRDVLDKVEGVILTVPHHLHYPIALESLRQGRHVLCEKPLAESAAQVTELIDTAKEHGVTLAVNNTMRLNPACRRVHDLIREGAIGEPRQLKFLMGEKFDWPAASGFYVGVGGAGRGVLLDKGPHALDLACWWLGGRPTLTQYQDDSSGGIEAVASVYFQYGSCSGEVHLSWLSRYENGYRIEGTAGAVEAGLYDWQAVTVEDARGRKRNMRVESSVRSPDDFATELVQSFIATLRGGADPLIPADAVLDSIAMIEECYARRERYQMPWLDVAVEVHSV